MASNPPDACCVKGFKHEGNALGRIGKVKRTIDTYFAYPPDGSTERAIILLTDILGYSSNNAQLVADQFAENGYFVVMPDLFHGEIIPLNPPSDFDLPAFLARHNTRVVDPVVEATLTEMKEKYGCKTIGGVGYCFGGKYVTRYLKKGLIKVGYSAHPSFVDEDELLAIEGPFAISAAETDNVFPTENRHRTEVLLSKTSQPWQLFVFSGVEHGFAVRGDMSDNLAKFAKEQAFVQAITWFKQWVDTSPQG